MVTAPIVQVRGLVKDYHGFRAVDDVSFEIRPGEIVGLLGPNGAGKTTIIHILLGLISPTAGDIRLMGLDLRTNREAILQRVNFTSAYVAMPYNLTVFENLLVFAHLYRIPSPRKKIDALLERMGMADLRNASTRTLSSGQATRLNLTKAFLNDPEVLLLDEPTASLDPDIADRTRTLLQQERSSRGLTMIYTSHNMSEVEQLCDRVIFLQKGKILAVDTPAGILKRFDRKTLEAVFLAIARDEV